MTIKYSLFSGCEERWSATGKIRAAVPQKLSQGPLVILIILIYNMVEKGNKLHSFGHGSTDMIQGGNGQVCEDA